MKREKLLAQLFLSLLLIGSVWIGNATAQNPQPKLVPRPRGEDANVRVWLDKGCNATYYTGERVTISFRTNQSGYITIYDVDTRGQVKVFFPNPHHPDNYINGGQTYRIPDRGYSYDLMVEGPAGTEYIQAVFSLDPYYRWDYNRGEPEWTRTWGLRGERFPDENNERIYRSLKERVNTNLQKLRTVPRDDGYRDYDTMECFFQIAYRDQGRYTQPPPPEEEYLDLQRREFERVPEIKVRREAGRLIVSMPSSVLFDTDSTALTAGSRDRLNQVSDILNRYPRTRIVVEGHTDSVGSNSYNFRLSEHRAESVSDYLVDQGVERFRITTIGYGENRPIASNATPEGRLQNRRVELKIRVDRSRFQTRDLEERRSERPRY
jgi:outer membrane protein OmpA-like peptidoglycan-associated protein